MTQTFSASPVSVVRGFGAHTNWLLLLMVLIWAECIVVCNCSVITRQVDVNDVENSSEQDNQESSDEVVKEQPKQSQYMNCYPVSSCYDDCTERLKGNLHVDRDCQALGAEYGFRATFVCYCHFEDIVHEEDYEGSNELPIFPSRYYKSSNSNAPKTKRNMKDDSLFFVTGDKN